MDPHRHDMPDESQLTVPQALRDDLRALCGRVPPVPGSLDADIAHLARRHFARRRRFRLALRLAPAIGAAAAAVALVIWPASPRERAADSSRPAMATADRGTPASYDLDDSGRVDILDAFLLARRLHGGDAVPDAWDFNADGRVDEHDADAIAARAVRVEDRS